MPKAVLRDIDSQEMRPRDSPSPAGRPVHSDVVIHDREYSSGGGPSDLKRIQEHVEKDEHT